MLSNNLLEDAVKFHGHLGPYLILGLKAGLLGIDYLGKDYFRLSAKVETASQPPRLCFTDGIQFTSGCTTGKGNINIKIGEGVSVEFTRGNHSISVIVKNDILKILDQITSDTQAETIGRELLQKTTEELFLIKRD
ncbi:MAG: formylmethanofuran dehydrogenase subunit [Thermoproteota archaeon]|nr:formylmethanofuran dehydrogenase subunit [Thermoproteota archaeon]